MATATAAATAARRDTTKETTYSWVGQDRAGKTVRGEMRASGEAQVNATLRRQGIKIVKVRKQSMRRGGSVTDKDIARWVSSEISQLTAQQPEAYGTTATP